MISESTRTADSTSRVHHTDLLSALTALRNGDFSARLSPSSAAGSEQAQIAQVFNELADVLAIYGPEARRVTREVGVEGRFGPQAEVPGVQGEWRALVDDLNRLAWNLTIQVRSFAMVTTAVANGDVTRKITVEAQGEIDDWRNTVNIMVDQLNNFASELTRLVREIGNEGKLGGQIEVRGVAGIWKDLINNVNSMSGNLTVQIRGISEFADALAAGDTTKRLTFRSGGAVMDLQPQGEIALLCEILERVRVRLASVAQQG